MNSLFNLTYSSKDNKTNKMKDEAEQAAASVAASTQRRLFTITSEDDGDLVLISNVDSKATVQTHLAASMTPADKRSPEVAPDGTSGSTLWTVWSAIENFVAEAEDDKNKAFLK